MKRREFHGMCGTITYRVWVGMMQRCRNEKNAAYQSYGGRGIAVCDEWSEFSAFLSDMGACPEGMSIDRIDNDKGYSRENCRWATRQTQSRNRRGRKLLTVNGETKLLCEWAEQVGLSHCTILLRLKKGYSPEDAVLTPKVTARLGLPRGSKLKDFHQQGVVWSNEAKA